MPSETRQKMEKSIALGVIKEGTIAKQYLDYYADLHPGFHANDAINEYNRFKDDIIARYVAGEGSTEIVKELYKRYDIKITAKTLISWLRELAVPIRPPTAERERLPHSQWEKKLWNRIEKLKTEVRAMKKQKQIELQAKDELITLLRSQIAELAKENSDLRAEVGRLSQVVGNLKTVK